MGSYKVVLSPSSKSTRVLVTHGRTELLKATLPPHSQIKQQRAASMFLEALALWLDVRLPVVLSVDAREAGSCLGLTNEMGTAELSVFYLIEVVLRADRRRRAKPMRGIGEPRDPRQLSLVLDPGDR
jgi:hypothetical protein